MNLMVLCFDIGVNMGGTRNACQEEAQLAAEWAGSDPHGLDPDNQTSLERGNQPKSNSKL
ncbi:hypothetical protein BCR44DRAFT_1452623, partial [Catenaria anguillulae PL171]